MMKSTSFVTGQDSPLKDRWGGWYVTGTSGRQQHMGNVIVQDRDHPEQLDRASGTNIVHLNDRFDKSIYLTADSDIVAHLVLAHQTQMHNLITETNYKTRIVLYNEQQPTKSAANAPLDGTISEQARKQFEEPAEALVEYLLFANEVPLTGRIRGTSGFAEQFAAIGRRDSRGRSLRDFDLHTRIFKYPCSYLIYSESFDALPEPAKQFIYHRLLQVLTEQDTSPAFARLSRRDRRNIVEILLATKKGLPAEWRQYERRSARTDANLARQQDNSLALTATSSHALNQTPKGIDP
jgi:hypothetical protein